MSKAAPTSVHVSHNRRLMLNVTGVRLSEVLADGFKILEDRIRSDPELSEAYLDAVRHAAEDTAWSE